MKKKFVYITAEEWFKNGALQNPLLFHDHKIDRIYPGLNRVNYDLKLLVTNAPTQAEKNSIIYNNYREKYGSDNIDSLAAAALKKPCKHVLLNNFDQAHFEYIVPYIKDTAEILYLFKCPKIHDFSPLSAFKNLKCLYVFWNNTLETLWDMRNNENLKVISFLFTTKLLNIDTLADSHVEYVTLDSSDNCGNKKPMLFGPSVFENMPALKHLRLIYIGHYADY